MIVGGEDGLKPLNIRLQSGWTKGKFNCPHCQARLGAFNFLGGSQHIVHLVKSQVDLHVKLDLTELLRSTRDETIITPDAEGTEAVPNDPGSSSLPPG